MKKKKNVIPTRKRLITNRDYVENFIGCNNARSFIVHFPFTDNRFRPLETKIRKLNAPQNTNLSAASVKSNCESIIYVTAIPPPLHHLYTIYRSFLDLNFSESRSLKVDRTLETIWDRFFCYLKKPPNSSSSKDAGNKWVVVWMLTSYRHIFFKFVCKYSITREFKWNFFFFCFGWLLEYLRTFLGKTRMTFLPCKNYPLFRVK